MTTKLIWYLAYADAVHREILKSQLAVVLHKTTIALTFEMLYLAQAEQVHLRSVFLIELYI